MSMPAEEITDEQMQDYIEVLERSAKASLNSLLELDEYERLARIIEWLSEKLPKRIT
jgi:hypothetical protein